VVGIAINAYRRDQAVTDRQQQRRLFFGFVAKVAKGGGGH
jgi:hypothetical protein